MMLVTFGFHCNIEILSKEDTFITAMGKCLWHQENASLEGWKQKQIIVVINFF